MTHALGWEKYQNPEKPEFVHGAGNDAGKAGSGGGEEAGYSGDARGGEPGDEGDKDCAEPGVYRICARDARVGNG